MHHYIYNNLEMGGLYILFKAGAMYETFDNYGVSHLMEHLVCRNFKHMINDLQMHGINYNGYTSESGVVIHFTGLNDELEPLQRPLVECITGGIDDITPEDFENEKKTVLTEYSSCFNDQLLGTVYNGMRKLYNCYMAIGERSVIENFTYDDMKRVYADRFAKPLKIVTVGPHGINFTGTEYNNLEDENPHRLTLSLNNPSAILEPMPADSRMSACICATKPIEPDEYSRFSMGLDMLARGLNSPMEVEIREKRGLCYSFINERIEYMTTGVGLFGCEMPKENLSDVIRIYDEFILNPGRFLTEERFNICKQMAKVKLETRRVLRFSDVSDLLRVGQLDPYQDIDTMTFGQVFDITKKYMETAVKYTT